VAESSRPWELHLELELIKQIRRKALALAPCHSLTRPPKGIGDDCAVVIPNPGNDLLITTDTICEGIHFRLSYFSPLFLGRKLASVNLSDIAAMGGQPRWALLNMEVPPDLDKADSSFWQVFFKGLCQRLCQFGAILIGGDTVSAPSDRLSLSLSLIGEIKTGMACYRSGAKPGDLIYCSGYTGEAACGLTLLENPELMRFIPGPVRKRLCLKHLDPLPRISLGTALSKVGVNSLIDTSDGIASDLAHIAEESGLRAIVFQDILPVSRAVRAFCRAYCMKKGDFLQNLPLEYVLFGGEDFELIWTISPKLAKIAEQVATEVLGIKPFLLGRMEKGKGCYLDTGLKRIDISFKGYEH